MQGSVKPFPAIFSRMIAVPVLLASIVVMAACTTQLPAQRIETFDLTTPSVTLPPSATGTIRIAFDEPAAARELSGRAIRISRPGEGGEDLENAQWTDRLPRLVQARLSEAFDDVSGEGGTTAQGTQDGIVAYRVSGRILAFQAIVSEGSGKAEVEIAFELATDPDGQVIRTRTLRRSVPLGDTGAGGVASALDRAFSGVAGDLSDWIFAGNL